MNSLEQSPVRHWPAAELAGRAQALFNWLQQEMLPEQATFVASRARAIIQAGDRLDAVTWHRFEALLGQETVVRLALADLLADTGLANTTLPGPAAGDAPVEWRALALAAYAWRAGYPLENLDPAQPPNEHSPAGQVVHRAAGFIRRQVQRTATERDRLRRHVAFQGAAEGAPGSWGTEAAPIAPLPPHFRPPIPVRYAEVDRDTLQVDIETTDPAPVERGDPITIRPADLPPRRATTPRPATRPAPRPVVMPEAVVAAGQQLGTAVRNALRREPMAMTRLRVSIRRHADGPGLYGLQVRVTCPGIRSSVAGTTDTDGDFTCELPVPRDRGLTYDVMVQWPRDLGGETEKKSITMSGDRTLHRLPFYRTLEG